jgi:hypothetical protein
MSDRAPGCGRKTKRSCRPAQADARDWRVGQAHCWPPDAIAAVERVLGGGSFGHQVQVNLATLIDEIRRISPVAPVWFADL